MWLSTHEVALRFKKVGDPCSKLSQVPLCTVSALVLSAMVNPNLYCCNTINSLHRQEFPGTMELTRSSDSLAWPTPGLQLFSSLARPTLDILLFFRIPFTLSVAPMSPSCFSLSSHVSLNVWFCQWFICLLPLGCKPTRSSPRGRTLLGVACLNAFCIHSAATPAAASLSWCLNVPPHVCMYSVMHSVNPVNEPGSSCFYIEWGQGKDMD